MSNKKNTQKNKSTQKKIKTKKKATKASSKQKENKAVKLINKNLKKASKKINPVIEEAKKKASQLKKRLTENKSLKRPETATKTENEFAEKDYVEDAIKNARSIFTSGEKVLYAALQKKLLNIRPKAVVVTNKRIILYEKGFFKANFIDYLWKDLADAHLREDILRSTISFELHNGNKFVIDKLPKDHARKIYSIAQEKEEEWREINRNRDLEEKRALSGGHHIVIGNDNESENKTHNKDSIKKKLKELKELLEDDLITNEEFIAKKEELIKKL